MRRLAIFTALVAIGSAAHAGDKPLYQAAPNWVKAAPPIDPAKLGADAPVVVVLDQQQRVSGGQLWNYVDSATRIATSQMLNDAGTVTLPWQPDDGDLLIHRAEILRGTERIDLLAAGTRFEVLHRESELERLSLDGILTATMTVPGLRVGDVLRMSFSTTTRDPAFGGAVQTLALLLGDPARAAFARYRLLWPSAAPLKWRTYVADAKPVIGKVGGENELTLALPLGKQPDLPGDLPARFQKPALIEATTFADWPAVSRVMAPLYATDGLIAPGSAVAQEVATIAAKSKDPRVRAALALQLVQDKVRYLYRGMEHGNYTPQQPDKTWSVRYGDCKAKTLLLLAILKSLDIEAEPVLASSQGGDALPNRLPLPGAFDHVLVHATIGGESLFLDGTGAGSRLADLSDTPDFHWVLPVRAAGAGLMAVPLRPHARPDIAIDLELNQPAGVRFPTLYKAVVTVRGPLAATVEQAMSQGNKEQKDNMVASVIGGLLEPGITLDQSLTYSPEPGTAQISAKGLLTTMWKQEGERYRLPLDRSVSKINFAPDRSRTAWQSLPVATRGPETATVHARVHLPNGGKDFVFEGDRDLDTTIAGVRIVRKVTRAVDWIKIDERSDSVGAEISPDALAGERAKLTLAKSRLLTINTPDGILGRTREAANARRDGGFKPILAAYAQAIANKPDEAYGYANRAAFLSGIFDYRGSLSDYDKVIAMAPTVAAYVSRSWSYSQVGEDAKALADAESALKLEPGSIPARVRLSYLLAEQGKSERALGLVDETTSGGDERVALTAAHADVLEELGRPDEGLATFDAALKVKPGNPNLLNGRCWLKGEAKISLDTALKDCTKAIELSDDPAPALDSRALIYFRMGRMDDAMTDLDAVLTTSPDQSASLYLRGVIRTKRGDLTGAAEDLASARTIFPQIDKTYAKMGIAP